MLRKLIVLTAVAGGMSIAGAMTLAVPALAKGPSQASITGPGLAHAIVVSGEGEPGQQGMLANLAEQTNLFTAMFGPDGSGAPPEPLGTPPPKASLGPRYTVVYTVPGIDPQPGDVYGRVRQDLYPRATGGPVTYTPPVRRGDRGRSARRCSAVAASPHASQPPRGSLTGQDSDTASSTCRRSAGGVPPSLTGGRTVPQRSRGPSRTPCPAGSTSWRTRYGRPRPRRAG